MGTSASELMASGCLDWVEGNGWDGSVGESACYQA